MLKLMIVDDEYLFREALKVSLPWQELGYEVCCEAENGIDALEKIKEFEPEVALIDINMPIMDGLELAAEIKETGLNTTIVIITGYEEFNYAHQAIQLGVENYLLKPLDENELSKILISIRTLYEKESAAKMEIEALKKQVQQYRPVMKEMVLNDLLQGNKIRSREDYQRISEYISSDIDNSSIQVVIMEMDEGKDCCWNAQDSQIWSFAVSNIAAEILSTCLTFDMCRDLENRINIIIYQDKTASMTRDQIINLCERIRISALKYLKFSISIGVGRPYDDIANLSLSYKEALYSLKNKLVLGGNKSFFFEDVAECDMKLNFYTVEQRKQLLMNIRVGDLQGVEGVLDLVFNQARLSNLSSELVIVMGVELLSTCLEYIAETGYKLQEVLGTYFNVLEIIQEKKSLDELESCIHDMFIKAYNLVHGGKNKKTSGIVEEAKKYIQENYSRFDLKIDDIARHTHIKYGHLCFLFKRETGCTINDYITEARIKKAKELMDEGGASVSIVSSRVGYADANYFGKCFKKVYGLTPGKYIDNIR